MPYEEGSAAAPAIPRGQEARKRRRWRRPFLRVEFLPVHQAIRRRHLPSVPSLPHGPVPRSRENLPVFRQLARAPREISSHFPRRQQRQAATRLPALILPRVQRGDRGRVAGSEEERRLQWVLPEL